MTNVRYARIVLAAAISLMGALPATARDPHPAWFSPQQFGAKGGSGEDTPLRAWFAGWAAFMDHQREIRRLENEQDRVIDEMAGSRPRAGAGLTFGDLADRRRRRQAMIRLHGLEQKVLSHQKEMDATARELAGKAGKVAEHLRTLRAQTLASTGEANATTTTVPRLAQRVERIDRMIELAEALAAQPDQAAQRMSAALTEIDHPDDASTPAPLGTMRLRERVEGLEREQRFLRQRLESNEASLRELKDDLERLGELYRRRRMPPREQHMMRQQPATNPPRKNP
jgi:hypothetical protein